MSDPKKFPLNPSSASLEDLSASSDELLRGLDAIGPTSKPEPPSADSISQSTFYSFSPTKLFWLSLITLGLYDFLWFYRFWRHFKIKATSLPDPHYPKNSRIVPFWCGLFSGYYIVGTARRIRAQLSLLPGTHASVSPWNAFWLYGIFGYINTSLAPLFVGPFSSAFIPAVLFCSAISSYQIYRLQALANEVNQAKSQSREFSDVVNLRFFDWVFIVFGCLYSLSIMARL